MSEFVFASVCSGIGAPELAWHDFGWRCAFMAEIDSFARAVLAHRFAAGQPSGPKLFGDFAKIGQNDTDGTIDLLVAGTPCQSFSVAGQRGGLDDPRGDLALEYVALARRLRPRWLVWENVPGVLSSGNGQDIKTFLDALEEIGYICDIDILDAQFFGVPQRRRRVFVCGQSRDDLLSERTDTSALVIAQCWQEILHGILAVTLHRNFIWARDRRTCRRCGERYRDRDPTFHVHHIAVWNRYRDLAFDPDNTVLLCRPCHRWVHSRSNAKSELLRR